MFIELAESIGATEVKFDAGKGIIATGVGSYAGAGVAFRPVSSPLSGGVPTVDINIAGIGIRKIRFN
jgi:hypothetical protein